MNKLQSSNRNSQIDSKVVFRKNKIKNEFYKSENALIIFA